jgi:hypothetical protein
MDRIEHTASKSSSIVACVFVATGTCLPGRCLATLRLGTQTHSQQGDLITLVLLDYFPYLEKIEQAYEITLLSVCVSLCIPL